MANFINPVEILHLEHLELSAIDSTGIKKAKRMLFADIDLSDDGSMDYKGAKLSKNDCEAVIDLLDDPSLLSYYHYLANNPAFNDYLTSGNDAWFQAYLQDDIFGEPGFLHFIGPLLAPRLDGSLLRTLNEILNHLVSPTIFHDRKYIEFAELCCLQIIQ